MWKKYILVFNLVMIFVNSMETGNKSDLINQQVGVEKNFKGSAPQGEEAEEEEEDEGPSFGGLLNGLLESFSNPKPHPPSPHPPQNSTTPQKPHPPQNPCPGRCVSPLASVFMCDKTTELFSCQGNQVCCHDDPPTAHPSDTKKITPSEILDDDDEEEEEQESVESVKLCDGVCIGKELAGEVCEEVREDGGACPKGSVCCGRSLNSTMATGTPTEKIKKKCEGTCRSMIFGLFLCDEIDSEAECGESHQACCVMKERPQQARPPQGVGHPQGAHPQNRPHPPQGARPTTQPHPQPQESEEDSPPPTQPRPPPSAPQSPSHPPPRPHQPHPQQPHPPPPPQSPPPPPPVCHAYCVALAALPYCRSPLPGTCGINAGCCGHDLQPVLRPVATTTTSTTTPPSTESDYDSMETPSAAVVAMETCPGQCIRPIMSFTCFLNAEMTDGFRCEDPKMKCCAPKKNLPGNSTQGGVVQGGGVVQPGGVPQGNNVVSVGTYNKFPPPPQQQQQPFPQQPFPQQFPQQPQFPPPPQQQPPPPPPLLHPKPDRTFTQTSRYICGVKGAPATSALQMLPEGLLSRRKRVVGGSDAAPGEWCWQVALINSMNQYLCGGALIGVEWVLTAAHCVTNIVRSGDSIYVRVGDHDLTSKYGSPGAQTLRVATTYIHHNHNSQTLDNDIALLKLQGQVSLKEGVCLICLPSRSGAGGNLLPGRRCTVTGYGYMGESGPIPLRVRQAELPIVSDGECIRKVNAVTEKPFVLPISSFCAGGEFKNDACQGDGGGPLVCREDDYYELTGLVSWGFGCGRKDVPGVYVKISSFIGWINQIISISN